MVDAEYVSGRLLIAAAVVVTTDDSMCYVESLVEAGVDAIVIETTTGVLSQPLFS